MEKAKQAVSNFVSGSGKHKTTVDEEVRKPVTEEHVRPHQHEDITTAVDKEVHQHHHHTTVQPLTTQEVLPEKHVHKTMPVENRTFEHGNDREVQEALKRDAAKYHDSSVTNPTSHSTSTGPVVSGERIYHHVHEHVQPVIEKETIAPETVHTTVPIHETHHAAAVHHGTSTLPTKTLDEYTTERGALEREPAKKVSEFEGCPRTYNKDLQNEQLEADRNMHLGSKGGVEGERTSNKAGVR